MSVPEFSLRVCGLPRWVGGGPGDPLGARALYLGNTDYRIHGTNDPSSIGKHVSSGCIRMRDADVIDLYNRVQIGTKVIVLPNDQPAVDGRAQRNMTIAGNQSAMTAQIAVAPVLQPERSSNPIAFGLY